MKILDKLNNIFILFFIFQSQAVFSGNLPTIEAEYSGLKKMRHKISGWYLRRTCKKNEVLDFDQQRDLKQASQLFTKNKHFLQRDAGKDTFSEYRLLNRIRSSKVKVIRKNSKLAAIIVILDDSSGPRIVYCLVSSCFRRQGLGKKLVENAFVEEFNQGHEKIRTEILSFNTGSRQFFESMGFKAEEDDLEKIKQKCKRILHRYEITKDKFKKNKQT